MIPTETLPDALAADLRDAFKASAPIPGFENHRAVLDATDATLTCPRIVFKCGDSKRITSMDQTARIPFTIDFITSMDTQIPDSHRTEAGILSAWLLTVKSEKRRALLACRVYLHDLYTLHPIPARPTAERECTTTIRGEAIVTLAEVEIEP